MADLNTTLYGKQGSTTYALNPKSIGTQIVMNDKSGSASNVDAEIVALRADVAALGSAVLFKGTLNGTTKVLPTTDYKAGWEYIVEVAGTYAGHVCEAGDAVLCIRDYAAGTASNADWTVLQVNLDGVVKGPATAVAGQIAVYDGTTGKVIKDSGFTIAKSVPADAVFTDTTYNPATSTVDGLMSSTDKVKMDTLEALPTKVSGQFLTNDGSALSWGALPVASTSAVGVVKVGANLSIDADGKLDATDTTYEDATTSVHGLMSTSDKSKLDTIDAFPTKVANRVLKVKSDASGYEWADTTVPIATTSATGVVMVGDNLTINASTGKLDATDTTYELATTTTDGLMSAADKTKVDGLEAFPTKVSGQYLTNDGTNLSWGALPVASTSAVGVVKVGTNLSVDAAGLLSATDTTYEKATASADGLMSKEDFSKLSGIEAGAEVNQNAYQKVAVGATTMSAAAKDATLTVASGDGITITADDSAKKVTIAETYVDVCMVSALADVPANLRDGGLIILKS